MGPLFLDNLLPVGQRVNRSFVPLVFLPATSMFVTEVPVFKTDRRIRTMGRGKKDETVAVSAYILGAWMELLWQI